MPASRYVIRAGEKYGNCLVLEKTHGALWRCLCLRCHSVSIKRASIIATRKNAYCADCGGARDFSASLGAREFDGINDERLAPRAFGSDSEDGNKRASSRYGRRRRAAIYEHDGKKLNLSEWSRLLDIPRATLYRRIRRGWPLSRVFEEPLHLEKRRIIRGADGPS